MSHPSLVLLGGFATTFDSQPLTAFGTGKVQALLAYLSVESARPHQRTALATLLWPDAPQEKIAHNLQQSLLRLRRVLHEDEVYAGLAMIKALPGLARRAALLILRNCLKSQGLAPLTLPFSDRL